MVWIESHQELGAHPKTQKLARLLDVSRPAAVGHLQFLWWWATDYAPDGDLSRFEALDIAIGGEWDGDAAAFVDALARAGFIDQEHERLRIHDWDQYAGRLIEKRRQDAERVKAWKSGLRAFVIERDGLICGICGDPVEPNALDVDHVIPVSKGGETTADNLRVTHTRCNRSRGNRW